MSSKHHPKTTEKEPKNDSNPFLGEGRFKTNKQTFFEKSPLKNLLKKSRNKKNPCIYRCFFHPPHPSIPVHSIVPSLLHIRLQDAQDFAGVCRVAGVQAIACIGGGVGLQGDLPLEPPWKVGGLGFGLSPVDVLSDFRWLLVVTKRKGCLLINGTDPHP